MPRDDSPTLDAQRQDGQHLDGEPVDPQVAFDQLARIVLADHTIESVLQKVAELANDVVAGADEVSVSLVGDRGASTAVFTGELAKDLDERQYVDGRGPCLDAATGGETVLVPDTATETRWPGYSRAAAAAGMRSSMSVPVPVQQTVHAALNFYSRRPEAFDADSEALGATFASYAAVAVANMHLFESTRRLAENLEVAMQSRAVIDQAKGILMAQQRCSAPEAFDLLVGLSQKSNRKLRDVAEALVAATAEGRTATNG